jgi:hypothetical protein
MSSKVVTPIEINMLMKVIDYYVFLDNEDFGITFCASGPNLVSYRDYRPMCKGNFQINIQNNNGCFFWKVTHKGQVLIKRFAKIKMSRGNLLSSDLSSMKDTTSIVTPDYALSYGFYDYETISTDFHTNPDRSYVYLTRNYSEWMKDLANKNPKFVDSPLNALALPGAHDAGMFETVHFKGLLNNDDFLEKLNFCLKIESKNFADCLERIVINMACTQKDNICKMLELGIRYFDFRPGYCYGPLKDVPGYKNKIFHQHGFIPGYLCRDFLCDIFKWLAEHPAEIVVVNFNFQGFDESSMKPDNDVLKALVSTVQLATKTKDKIAIGDQNDLSVTIRQLLDEKKRLIFLNQIETNSDAQKCDSYNKSVYATTDVNNILTALENMKESSKKTEAAYIVLQLQGTATADITTCSRSIICAINKDGSDAMSPLMLTKADFDHSTYPWLENNVVPDKFSPNKLLVFINDFVDNALVKHAIDITSKRIGL